MLINLKESFTYMFKDKKFWSKYVIGVSLAIFTLIVSMLSALFRNETFYANISWVTLLIDLLYLLVFAGYLATLSNSKITQDKNDLPEWFGNLSDIIKNGWKIFLGGFLFLVSYIVILIPVTLLLEKGLTAYFGTVDLVIKHLPQQIEIIMYCYFYLICMIFMFLLLMALTSFYVDLKVLSFFNFKRVFKLLKRNFLNFFLIFVLFIIYNVLCSVLYMSIPKYIYYLYAVVFGFYMGLVFTNMWAQYVKIGMQNIIENVEKTAE